jgi:glycogen synthase
MSAGSGEPRRLRIVHFGYEDPAQPGAGGGSVRTHEINRRLAGRHDITVVAAGWPGAADRVEEGVRYLHAGSGRGRNRALSYFARIPRRSRRVRADLVVEDFGAPIGSVGLPRFTAVPVVAMVQWLFAREMSARYHLPFHLVEAWGLRAHDRLIAVSEGLAGQLRQRRAAARVHVVPNGVDPGAFAVRTRDSRFGEPLAPIAYLGRLDIVQKGLDTLLHALVRIPGERRLHVIGDGPDERRLHALAASLGLTDRIVWHGRVGGAAKYRLLGDAAVVAVPSRYETFGMVAAEALAAGTPVVASDIPCLRDVVPDAAGVRVPPENPVALAAGLTVLLADPRRAAGAGRAGREFARRFDWDRLAAQQEASYLAAATPHREGTRGC